MCVALSPRSKPSLKNERSTLCSSSGSLKKAQTCWCRPRLPSAHRTELPFVATCHLLSGRACVKPERATSQERLDSNSTARRLPKGSGKSRKCDNDDGDHITIHQYEQLLSSSLTT